MQIEVCYIGSKKSGKVFNNCVYCLSEVEVTLLCLWMGIMKYEIFQAKFFLMIELYKHQKKKYKIRKIVKVIQYNLDCGNIVWKYKNKRKIDNAPKKIYRKNVNIFDQEVCIPFIMKKIVKCIAVKRQDNSKSNAINKLP